MTIFGVSHTAILFYLWTTMSCYMSVGSSWKINNISANILLWYKTFLIQITDMKSADKACHFLLSMVWCHLRNADAHM